MSTGSARALTVALKAVINVAGVAFRGLVVAPT